MRYTPSSTLEIKIADSELIRVIGRHTVTEDGMLALDWCSSGFSFIFNGRGFNISFGAFNADAPAYIKVVIDGRDEQRFAVANGRERVIIENLYDKRHRVTVYKITESESPLLFDTLTLFGEKPSLRRLLGGKTRRLEFIGDSITCGYGVLGSESDSGYLTWQQDSTLSYASLTAKLLGAEPRLIAVSGKGLVCNCLGDRSDVKVTQFYEYLTRRGGVCRDGWIPHAVVINAGTNDSGGPAGSEEFAEAANSLLDGIRARYPEAEIFWLYGMMNTHYTETLRETIQKRRETDPKLHYVITESITSRRGETGANGHPGIRASIRVAEELSAEIQRALGWKPAPRRETDEDPATEAEG